MSHHSRIEDERPVEAAGPHLVVAREVLSELCDPLRDEKCGDFKFSIYEKGQSLWLIIDWPDGASIAARPIYAPGTKFRVVEMTNGSNSLHFSVDTSVGVYHTQIDLPAGNQPLVHWRTSLIPAENLRISGWPADLYPIGPNRDPFGVAGSVHTAQKGPTGAIVYATMTRPWRGSFLYVQNLTELNDYFEKTKTSGKDCISNEWPELGFRLPAASEHALQAGQDTVISDAYLLVTPEAPENKLQAARLFLELYADVYLAIPKSEPMFRDWTRLVDQTLRDLTHSRACGVEIGADRYLLAYVGADDRPPESMVQLAVLLPIIEYTKWLNDEIAVADQIRANLPSFYEPKIKSVVRWLPGQPVPRDEEHMGEEIMDSWYLYHTYLNLSRLAKSGDKVARRLFLDSVDYGINVARHFSYRWPVFYNIYNLDVIKSETEPGRGGEHDVGAQYVHVMMQGWDLTGEQRFLEEAERAAEALEGLGFDLGYQFNNTSFGAGALLRLWKETGKRVYFDLSLVCLANVVRNFWLWDCQYGFAKKNYHTFLGMIPLRNSTYLALYEELETLAAFHDYLQVGGEDVPPSVRVLLCEYCKFLIDRAWYHYPANLPEEVIESKPRSGHINRAISIPLEDIYEGWEKAGKVGQQVYGAAAPFAFTTRHCHRVDGVKFRIHCDYPIADFSIKRGRNSRIASAGKADFRILGDRRCRSHVRIVPDDFTPLPEFEVKTTRGRVRRTVRGEMMENGYLEFAVPGNASVIVSWTTKSKPARRVSVARNGKANSNHEKANQSRRASHARK